MLEFATQTEAPADELTSTLPDLDRQGLEELLYNWEVWARDDQLPPLDTQSTSICTSIGTDFQVISSR